MEASGQPRNRYLVGDLEVDSGTRSVTRGGSEIDLPKLSFDLLVVLIEAAPNVVSPDRLMETVWAGLVVSPETVTQRVKLLRDALGDNPQDPRYIALVRGAGYRLIAPVRRPGEDQAAPGNRATAPIVVLAAVLIAVAAGVIGLIYRGDWQSQTQTPGVAREAGQTPSIAVLPFANRSDLEADAFFADGIHDHLLVQLARIQGLRVISRTSVMGYRDRAISIPQIARELDVGVILEGAVQRAGDQVRISVQLIDGRDDRNLWAEIFDRPLSAANVFAIQGEISRAVADQLKVSLLPAERARLERPATLSLAAYDAYLKGRAEMNRFTEAGLNAAVARFQAAVAEDPEFALAYIGLAEARMLQQRFLLLNRELAVQLAETSLARALEIDPALPEALSIRGDMLRLQGDFEAAEASYRQAIALNPNLAAAYLGYGWLLMEQERVAEQMEMWQQAGRLDPLSPVHRTHGAFTEFRAGRLLQAETELRMILEQHPDFPLAHVILGEVLAGRGDQAGAIGHFRRALEMNPSLPLPHVGLIEALLDLELDAAAEAALERAWSVPDLTGVGLGMEFLIYGESSPPSAETVAGLWKLVPALDEVRPLRAAHAAATLHLLDGAHAQAMEVIEAAEPRLAGNLEALSLDGLQRALYCPYAFALIQAGETDRGRAVARWVLEQILTGPDYARRRHLDPIVCHTVLGETDRALAALQEAAESGVPSGWRFFAFRPELEALRAHPEFDEVMAAIRAQAGRQRKRVLTVR